MVKIPGANGGKIQQMDKTNPAEILLALLDDESTGLRKSLCRIHCVPETTEIDRESFEEWVKFLNEKAEQ